MKNKFFYGLMAATGLLFAGCSSDDITPVDPSKVLESDQAFYVSMRISGDVPGSRSSVSNGEPDANDFADGTGVESTISSAYFVFYDENGNTVGDVVNLELDNSKWITNADAGSVEKYYKSVAKVSVTKGEKAPTQVICYLNPVNSGNLRVNLAEIQTLQLETAVKGSGESRRFPMSNSVYYPNDDAVAPNIAVPLTMGVNVFTSEEDAEKANADNNYAEIYVERYASKLTFDATPAAQSDFVTGQRVWGPDGKELETRNKITLHFNPQFWAVNAEAKNTYVIKSFRKENVGSLAPGEYNYTFDELNSVINDGLTGNDVWKWNAPQNFRSYWGMSPAYFTETYPEVSSDLDKNHSELQKYISYNELLTGKQGFSLLNADGTFKNSADTRYFKETTVGSVALSSKNPAAAVASVIFVGQYSVDVNGTPAPLGTGFYSYLAGPVPGDPDADNRPYIYFENEENSLTSKVSNAESMLKRFLIQCSVLYKKVGDEYVAYEIGDGTGLNSLAKVLSVSQMTDAERYAYDGNENTELKLQHNARTLRFDAAPADGDNIFILTYTGYKKVVDVVANQQTEMSVKEANIALARNVGFALYYTLGHSYFNIPVRHLGWYRAGNENNKPNATFDWSKVRVGDFGMVRNHAYTVQVDKITGLGLGIGGDDVELVPPSSETNYYVSYQVHILRWAIVPTQSVELN